ncbi:MAG TPA: hypothetical protein VJN63_05295 [Thermoplasmata archaeon]|nr:hypothetical protein [Thermoplasmata archaeon]
MSDRRRERVRRGRTVHFPQLPARDDHRSALMELSQELRIHAEVRCAGCYVSDVGWHESVCLTPDELNRLLSLLKGNLLGP